MTMSTRKINPGLDSGDLALDLLRIIGVLVRRVRYLGDNGQLTAPERSALVRLEKEGPMGSADLARAEQISPQSMGTTVSGLERQELITRTKDPTDGRRILLNVSETGLELLRFQRDNRTDKLTAALESLDDRDLRRLKDAITFLEALSTKL